MEGSHHKFYVSEGDNYGACIDAPPIPCRTRLQVDHIVPWSAGGSDHPVNLRVLCEDCNQWRGNRVADMHVAHVLAIAYRCMRCAVPAGSGRAIAAWCLTCQVEGVSPFNLVGGRVPATGVPAAALADVASMVPVVGQAPPPVIGTTRVVASAPGG